MMHYIKVFLGVLLGVAVFMFLDYALPSKNTVRVTNTYNRLTEIGSNRMFYAAEDTGTVQNAQGQRDIRFIETVRPNGKVHVYRNEDTGWIWPPYFKFDSSDLQAEAAAAVAPNKDQWVVITHYGWRNKYLTIFPNAIGIRKVEGPDVTVIPWFNIFFFVFVLFAFGMIRAMWRQFRERSIDPALEDMSDSVSEQRGRLTRWLDTWRRK